MSEQAHRRDSHVMTVFQLAVIIPVVVGTDLPARAAIRPSCSTGTALLGGSHRHRGPDARPGLGRPASLPDVPHPAQPGHRCNRLPPRAFVALVGSFDPRELRNEIGPLKAAFNRCQIALSVFAESVVYRCSSDALMDAFHLTGRLDGPLARPGAVHAAWPPSPATRSTPPSSPRPRGSPLASPTERSSRGCTAPRRRSSCWSTSAWGCRPRSSCQFYQNSSGRWRCSWPRWPSPDICTSRAAP